MNESDGWIGRSTPRREAKRFAEGRGRYTDDLDVANVGHIAFLRSPIRMLSSAALMVRRPGNRWGLSRS